MEKKLEEKINEAKKIKGFSELLRGIEEGKRYFIDLLFNQQKQALAYIVGKQFVQEDFPAHIRRDIDEIITQSSLGGILNGKIMYPRSRSDDEYFTELTKLEITKDSFLVTVKIGGYTPYNQTFNLKKPVSYEDLSDYEKVIDSFRGFVL